MVLVRSDWVTVSSSYSDRVSGKYVSLQNKVCFTKTTPCPTLKQVNSALYCFLKILFVV